MSSCWCWQNSKRRSERADATSSASFCDAASATSALSRGSGRRPAARADSRTAFTLGPVDWANPSSIQLSCRRGAGAFSSAAESCSGGPVLRRCVELLHGTPRSGCDRQALFSIVQRAKRNKAFEHSGWIGLAIDGTGAGWRTRQGCALCRRQRNTQQQILGYQHYFVMSSVVGTGLSLPLDVEPYGPGDSEYVAGKRLLRRVIGSVGKRF